MVAGAGIEDRPLEFVVSFQNLVNLPPPTAEN
jgi:hypothetical protein